MDGLTLVDNSNVTVNFIATDQSVMADDGKAAVTLLVTACSLLFVLQPYHKYSNNNSIIISFHTML